MGYSINLLFISLCKKIFNPRDLSLSAFVVGYFFGLCMLFVFAVLTLFLLVLFANFELTAEETSGVRPTIRQIVLFGPIEELIFRVVPLTFVQDMFIWKFNKNHPLIICLAVGISSLLFGIAHSNPCGLLVQGTSGVWFSVIYLRYGGYIFETDMWQSKDISKAFVLTSLVHISYNLILLI